MSKRVVISNDHGAIELKARVAEHLRARGFEVTDVGVTKPDSVDYPDMAVKAVEEYRKGGYEFGVVLCGTGIGISIAANKHKGIRCALLFDEYSAQMAKEHNDANFIALGGRINYPVPVERILDKYIDSSFLGDRHQRRVDKLNAL
jgi:ribose 5-phosphate isomerase B